MDICSSSCNLYIELIMTTYKAIHGKLVQSLASDPDTAAYEGQLWFNSASGDFKTITRVAGSWSTGGALNTASIGTNGIVFGGDLTGTPHTATTELFDGTSWTEQGDLPVATNGQEGFGTGANAVSAGGNSPPNTYLNTTNEWTGEAAAASNFTSS